MSTARRPPGPVRQLSLQQPPRRQQVRRQRSAEDEKQPLQVFANPIRSRLSCGEARADPDRPKVRLAWGEGPGPGPPKVVARQMPGKPRPPTAKSKAASRPPIGEKASILYSRQELAERLRLAWKQREENRANIDIFLAHNAVETGCESRPSSCAVREDEKSAAETSRTPANDPPPAKTREEDRDPPESEIFPASDEKTRGDSVGTGVEAGAKTAAGAVPSKEPKSGGQEAQPENKKKEQDARAKRASFSNSSVNGGRILSSGGPPPAQPPEGRRERQAPNIIGKDQSPVGPPPAPCEARTRRTNSAPPLNQRSRSASTLSNPAAGVRTQVSIVIDAPSIGGGSSASGNREVKSDAAAGGGAAPQELGPTRASIPSNRAIKSAPIKRRAKSGKRRPGPGGGHPQGAGAEAGASCEPDEDIGEHNIDGKQRRSFSKNRQTLQAKVPDVVTMVSLVSSADSDSDIDQNSPRDDKLIHELRNKLPTTPIIKTSASCCPAAAAVIRKPIKSVSFQHHESFEIERDNNPQEAQGREDNRKWGVIGVFGQQKYPVVCRGGGSALPTPEEANIWRSEDATSTTTTANNTLGATATTFPSSSSSSSIAAITRGGESNDKESDETILTPVTDREKRCLAVPIGDPIRDKKRRLLRTRSTPPARPYGHSEDGSINGGGQLNSAANEMTGISRNRDIEGPPNGARGSSAFPGACNELPVAKIEAKTAEDSAEIISESDGANPASSSSEPKFQTTKERECWHLYRRMCDKGVYVSFDTVLRGMLTPTEYRLRQKESAADC